MCRFVSEVSSVATLHVDTDVTAVTGGDELGVPGTVVEPGLATDDAVAGGVATGDIATEEQRSLDEGKESVDASAARNQRQLLLFGII